jgi:hypothetical protein
MSNIIQNDQVDNLAIDIRGKRVLLDSDVAMLYGVETKQVNEAVSNNLDKFPYGCIFELKQCEKIELVKKFDRFNKLKHLVANSKVFTEKGLYMLATILKSPKATQTTISMEETFVKIREINSSRGEHTKYPLKAAQITIAMVETFVKIREITRSLDELAKKIDEIRLCKRAARNKLGYVEIQT